MSAEIFNVEIFGINLKINPVAFKVFGWSIYWYGIIIAAGFLLAILYAMKNAKRFELDPDRMLDVVLVSTPIAVLSARLYYVIFDKTHSIKGIKGFFGIGTAEGFSGLAIYGGVIGAFVAGYLMCKIRKVNILDMFDLASVGFIIGQTVGRWGNFTNQEAFGTPTGSDFFGMMSEKTGGVHVHPCFLYESIWCLIGFFILNKLSKKRSFKGEILLTYLAWYGFGRTFIEALRTDSLYIGRIKVSLLLSAVVCITSIILLILIKRRQKTVSEAVPYVPMFSEEIELMENPETEETAGTEESETTEKTEEAGENDDTVD